jgi:NDP-glycosyltransferase
VADRCHARPVQLSPHFAYAGKERYWDKGVGSSPAAMTSYADRLDTFLATQGIGTRDNLWHVENLNIHFIPERFQYRREQFDDRFFFSGSLAEVAPDADEARPIGREPIVLISGYSGLPETQSSNEQLFRTFIEALAGFECRCILSIGDRISPSAFGTLPANFEINQHHSHLEILPRVTLFACHAGMGSSLEALYNGVPVLAIPGSPYTDEVAYRIADLGIGARLPRAELSAENVRRFVAQMLGDPQLQERARTMQAIFRSSGGVTATADRVDAFIGSA